MEVDPHGSGRARQPLEARRDPHAGSTPAATRWGPAGANAASHEPRRLAWIGWAAPLTLYLAHAWVYLRYVNDDAYITFRYSRFLASGLGPYFNVGEHVEGYSNLLLMLLLAAVYAVGGEAAVPYAARVLGIASGGAALLLAFACCRRLAGRVPGLREHAVPAAATAAGLVAVFPGYALNSTSGLETTLFGALVMAALVVGARQEEAARWRGGGLLWAAASLTRPEGPALFAAQWLAGLAGWLRRPLGLRRALPRHALLDGACVAGAVAAQLGLRVVLYDAELLPNTYHAKTGGGGGLSAWAYVRSGALAPFLGVAGAAAGLSGWWRLRALISPAAPLLAVALFGAGLPLVVGADWMPGWRFAVPFLPPLASVVVLGWLAWLAPALSGRRAVAAALALLTVAGAALSHQEERATLFRTIELRADGYESGHRALARWLSDSASAGDTVALMDIGIVGYELPALRILDITGLTDRTIGKSPGGFLDKRYDPAYVLDQEPEFIVLVLWAPGSPERPLPRGTRLRFWTRMEAELARHPEFAEHYRLRPGAATRGAGWLDGVAARVGAVRVFEHAHPGQYYLLAVFRRHETEESAG